MKTIFIIISLTLFTKSYSQTNEIINLSNLNGWVQISVDGPSYRNCNGQKCNGLVIDTFPNGKIEEISNFINGNRDGLYIHFFSNGEIKWFGNYNNGMSIGEWKSYYISGKLKSVTLFENGDIKKEIGYFENGKYSYGREISDDGFLLYDFSLEENGDTNIACFVSDWQTKKYYYVSYYENRQLEQRGFMQVDENNRLIEIGSWVYYDKLGKPLNKKRKKEK